jgi:pyridoxine 4-dehydrogenase
VRALGIVPECISYLSTAEFYDDKAMTTNLDLLAACFEKHLEYADKTFLSVKGGFVENRFEPNLS